MSRQFIKPRTLGMNLAPSSSSNSILSQKSKDDNASRMIDVTCPVTETEWEGYLYKQSKFVKSWTPRYVTMHNGLVTYYKSKKHAIERIQSRGSWMIKEVLESLPSSGIGGSKLQAQTLGFSFLATNGNLVHFIAITQIEKLMWLHMMKKSCLADAYTAKIAEGQNVDIEAYMPDFSALDDVPHGGQQLFAHLARVLSVGKVQELLDTLPNFVQFLSMDVDLQVNFEVTEPTKNYGFMVGSYCGREGFVHFISLYRTHFLLGANSHSPSKLSKNDGDMCEITGTHQLINITSNSASTGRLIVRFYLSPSRRVSKIQISFRTSTTKSARDKVKAMRPFVLDTHPQNFHTCYKSKRALALSFHDFDILGVLGQGGFGTVILVKRHTGGEYFAIKVIDKRSGSVSALKERRILSNLRHPFLGRLRFAFQTESSLYLGLDFYTGGNLYYHMHSIKNADGHHGTMETIGGRRFDVDRARFYAAELCLAFSYLHSHGIIYRDLKPDNIMLDDHGHIRLVDFGISKQLVDEQSTGTLAGSPAYIAPEQLSQQRPQYGFSADWWSFGVLLYEMLRGNPPFHDMNISTMYSKIQTEDVKYDVYPPLPDDAIDLLKKLLVRDPDQRIGFLEIKQHPFFSSINWVDLLQKRIVPPFMPSSAEVFENVTQHFQKMEVDSLNVTPVLQKSGAKKKTVKGGKEKEKEKDKEKDADQEFEGFSFCYDASRRSSTEYYHGLVAQLQEDLSTIANEQELQETMLDTPSILDDEPYTSEEDHHPSEEDHGNMPRQSSLETCQSSHEVESVASSTVNEIDSTH